MNNEIDRRRQSFVNWQVQGNLVLRLVGYLLLYHFILWNVMFLHHYLQYQGQLSAGASARTFMDLYTEFTVQHYSVVVCAIALFPLLMWDGIRFSHRIAGPLVRVQNALQQLTQGRRTSEIQLRKDDLMEQLAECVNELLRSKKFQTQDEIRQREEEASAASAQEERQLMQVIEQLHSIAGDDFGDEPVSGQHSSRHDQILLNTEEKWG